MKKFQFLTFIAVATFSLTIGCEANKGDEKSDSDKAHSGEHSHEHGDANPHHIEGHSHGKGPHDGAVADWGGGKFHVEFTVDHEKQESTVYILGGDETTPTPIDAEEVTLSITAPAFTVILKASPQDGDPEGKASRYVGNHESLGVEKEFEGSMSAVVGGTPYSGKFKQDDHDH